MPTHSKSILTDKRSMWIQVHCIINTNGHFPASALCMSASQTSQQCNTYWGQKRQRNFKLTLSVKYKVTKCTFF